MTDYVRRIKLIDPLEGRRVAEVAPVQRRGKEIAGDPMVPDVLTQLTTQAFPEAVDYDRPAGQEVWQAFLSRLFRKKRDGVGLELEM